MAGIAFGPFVLEPERGVLLRDGQPVPLGQRAFSVLTVLAESPGQAVPKAELMARVWPDTFVEEDIRLGAHCFLDTESRGFSLGD